MIEAVKASIEALKVAVSLMEELTADYQTSNHERWAVAYRWVVAANDLCWHCSKLLKEFDDKHKSPPPE